MKKDVNRLLSKYRNRVVRRAVIVSLLWGLVIACFAMFASSVVIYFADVTDYFWVSFVVLGVAEIVSFLLLYFLRYRPTEKDIAVALDALGLEERAVTMLELEGSNSYIARAQRADTRSTLSHVPLTAVKVAMSTVLMVFLIVALVLGFGGTAYTILADTGVAPGSGSITVFDNTPVYTVTYEDYDKADTYSLGGEAYAVGTGVINGDMVQMVREGEDCATVYAEAAGDSIFVCWVDDDGNELSYSAERTDYNVVEDMTIYAVFVEFAFDEDGDPTEGGGNEAEEGDVSEYDDDVDTEEGDEDDNDSDGGGDPGGGDSPDLDSGGDNDANEGLGSGGLGTTDTVIDGSTKLTDEIESAIDDFRDLINSDPSLTDEEKAALNAYIDTLIGML